MIYNESFGAFLTAIPPINMLQLPVLPLTFVLKYRSVVLDKLNTRMMQLQYIVFMLIYFTYFIILSIVLLPVAYVIAVFDKLSTINQQASFSHKLNNNLIFIPLGVPILCINLVADIVYFWRNNFRVKDDLKKIIVPIESYALNHQSIRSIMKIFVKYNDFRIKTTKTIQVIKHFNHHFNVVRNI